MNELFISKIGRSLIIRKNLEYFTRAISLNARNCSKFDDSITPTDVVEPPIPAYEERVDEPIETKRARLLYQSRKRGMLENDLLLSTFAARYLDTMSVDMLKEYDRLINLPSNDWDLYYWTTGVRPTPVEFDTKVMRMLQEHVKNKSKESRIRQPDLYQQS